MGFPCDHNAEIAARVQMQPAGRWSQRATGTLSPALWLGRRDSRGAKDLGSLICAKNSEFGRIDGRTM